MCLFLLFFLFTQHFHIQPLLPDIILETIASLNEINPLTSRLIQIARDGKISDDEVKDFAFISNKLDEISLAINSLNLWEIGRASCRERV